MGVSIYLEGSVEELDVILKGINSVLKLSTGLLKLVHLGLKPFDAFLLLSILSHQISELLLPGHRGFIVPMLKAFDALQQPCHL